MDISYSTIIQVLEDGVSKVNYSLLGISIITIGVDIIYPLCDREDSHFLCLKLTILILYIPHIGSVLPSLSGSCVLNIVNCKNMSLLLYIYCVHEGNCGPFQYLYQS